MARRTKVVNWSQILQACQAWCHLRNHRLESRHAMASQCMHTLDSAMLRCTLQCQAGIICSSRWLSPIMYQVYTTNGRRMCAQRATLSYIHDTTFFRSCGHKWCTCVDTLSQHFVDCIQYKERISHLPCMSRRRGCRQRSFCSLKMPTITKCNLEFGVSKSVLLSRNVQNGLWKYVSIKSIKRARLKEALM